MPAGGACTGPRPRQQLNWASWPISRALAGWPGVGLDRGVQGLININVGWRLRAYKWPAHGCDSGDAVNPVALLDERLLGLVSSVRRGQRS